MGMRMSSDNSTIISTETCVRDTREIEFTEHSKKNTVCMDTIIYFAQTAIACNLVALERILMEMKMEIVGKQVKQTTNYASHKRAKRYTLL